MWDALDKLDEPPVLFPKLGGQRTPRDRRHRHEFRELRRRGQDLLRSLDRVETREQQHLFEPGGSLDPIEESRLERVGQEVRLLAELSQVRREVRGDVEDRPSMAHAQSADPADERLGQICVDVVTMAMHVVRLTCQQAEQAVGEEVDVDPGVLRAAQPPDYRQVCGDADREDQHLRVER